MESCIFFSINFLTVSKQSSNEFWHLKTMRILGFLCFNVNPLSLLNRRRVRPLVDDGFDIGLAFAAGFLEAFSSSWIGMASLTNLPIPFTILVQDSVWSLNKDWTLTLILYLSCSLQTPLSETGPKRTLLWIHPFIFVPFWNRGNVISRHKDWFASLLGDGREKKNCPTSTDLKPASEHSLDNFWSSDNFSNRSSYTCNRFPCRSSLACNSARGGCVKISCLSNWSVAIGFTRALRPIGNSSIISAAAPQRLSWLTEITIWRSNSIFSVLPLKWTVVFPPPLLLACLLSKGLVHRNIGWPESLKFCSIFQAVRFQEPCGLPP